MMGRGITRPYRLLICLLICLLTLGPGITASAFSAFQVDNDQIYYKGDGPSCSGGGPAGATISKTVPLDWHEIIVAAVDEYPTNPNFLAALFLSENGNAWKPVGTDWPVSPVGAAGPMQFMPDTWASVGIDAIAEDGETIPNVDDPADAMFSAAKYVSLDEIGAKTSTPIGTLEKPLALNTLIRSAASYNWGSGHVASAGEDASLSDLPPETQNYVKNIHALLNSDLKTGSPPLPKDVTGGALPGGGSGGGSGCEDDGGISTIDGLTFPLKTTKTVIRAGSDGAVWCYESPTNCHHDYRAADIMVVTGTTVIAAKEGRVVLSRVTGSVGSIAAVLGEDRHVYYYAHMGKGTLKVESGATVTNGQEIGKVGTRADASGTAPHLHFDLLPPPFTNRVSCSSLGCTRYPFIDVQPQLIKLYEGLPDGGGDV